MDNMLIGVRDDQWKKLRTVMSPTFTTGKMKKMKPLIEECVNTLMNNLHKLSQTEHELDLKRVFGAFTMEAIIEVAFGTKVDALFDETNPLITNARKMFATDFNPNLIVVFLVPKLAQLLNLKVFKPEITNFFKEFTLKIINERKDSNNSVKRVDFLQLMLDSMEDKDISDNEETDEKNDIKDNLETQSIYFDKSKYISIN